MQMQQQEKVRLATGRVEAVARNQPDRFGIKVAGNWYSGWGTMPDVSAGQDVAIAYVENGRFRNVRAIEVLPTSTPKLSDTIGTGSGPSDKDVFVARCVAMKASATLHANEHVEEAWQYLMRDAKTIAEWLLGKGSTPTRVDREKGETPSSSQSAEGVRA